MTTPSSASAHGSPHLGASRQAAGRPRQVTQRLPRSRIGWDRKFRVLMLVVLVLVGWVGAKAALSMYSAHRQAAQEGALLQSLRVEHSRLLARERALNQPATISRDARQLGMVRAGERAYFLVHRSGN